MKAVFSNRAYTAVLAETTEKIKTETGGLYLGVFENDTWYIVEAIDPGPNSVFEVAYFEYDQPYTQHLIRKIANLYESEMCLIGLWHRHPGSFDVFSSTDDETNSKYAKLNKTGAISALVNIDPDFRITMYHVERPCKYTKIPYEVGDDLIPEKFLKYKGSEQFCQLMEKQTGKNGTENNLRAYHKSVSFSGFLKTISPCFDAHICEKIIEEPDMEASEVRQKILDQLIDDIIFIGDDIGAEITVLQREKYIVLAQEAITGTERLYFAYSQPEDKVVFEYKGKTYYYEANLFQKSFNEVKAKIVEEKKDAFHVMQEVTKIPELKEVLRFIRKGLTGGQNDENH